MAKVKCSFSILAHYVLEGIDFHFLTCVLNIQQSHLIYNYICKYHVWVLKLVHSAILMINPHDISEKKIDKNFWGNCKIDIEKRKHNDAPKFLMF